MVAQRTEQVGCELQSDKAHAVLTCLTVRTGTTATNEPDTTEHNHLGGQDGALMNCMPSEQLPLQPAIADAF